jgi:ketosteroid isomerase-like protein
VITDNRTVIACIVTVLVCGCRSSPLRVSACGHSGASLAAAAEYLVASDNARDLPGVLAGYTDDVTWLPPVGAPLHGKADISPRYEQLFAGFSVALESKVVEAHAAQDIGFVVGTTEGTLSPLPQGPPVIVNDKFIANLRCEGERWVVSHLMWSPQTVSVRLPEE